MKYLMNDITTFSEASPEARAKCIAQIKQLRKQFGWICIFLFSLPFLAMLIFNDLHSTEIRPLSIIFLLIYIFTISKQMTYESFDVVLKKLEALTARPDTAETPAPEGSGQE